MTITPLILAARAVATELARRIYLPVVGIAGGVLVVLIAVSIWLCTVSAWWWFLLAPLIIFFIAFAVAAIVAHFAITLLRPDQTKEQTSTVRSFVDGLQKNSETVQTPQFILLFRIVKDLLFPPKRTFIEELSEDALGLKDDFKKIITLFS